MSPSLASTLDAFHEEESYQGKRCRSDGTVLWYGKKPIASRDRIGRVHVLPETAAWSEPCRDHLIAVKKTFPDAIVSVVIPLPSVV